LQAFDARGVAGPRHVTSAYLHMQRALTTGRTRLRDHGAILAVYLAGTDQLERALGRVGLQADTREIVLVRSPAGELSEVLRSLGFSASPPQEAQGPTEETLRRLGIDVPASGGVPRERWELLVLEQTAMVDLPR
ncbi:MAG: hypothetical protein M1143_01410, partial [Candidatus Thermoplasmatota archaeon]|nr:hypothetical protein [Candidatus Thermoplasmatota archaeon]